MNCLVRPAVRLGRWGRFLAVAGLALASSQASERAASVATLYVAAHPRGEASGATRADAADFRRAELWSGLNARLRAGAVTVIFLEGTYVISADAKKAMPPLRLEGLGDAQHQLVLEGETAGAVVFTRHADDPAYTPKNNQGPGFLFLRNCRNLVLRRLRFTAPGKPIGYATQLDGSRHIVVEDCHWHDLDGVYYGASGTTGADTSHVTFRRCRFERVGSGAHAHMVYNAYDPRHIRFVDCHFEDCSGDYVRFRDGTDCGVVTGCTFRSTGRYTGTHQAFIAIPLFNDDNPAKKKARPNYEYFGSRFLFFGNRFIYETEEAPAARTAILFHHSGFDPPGRRHLLDAAEAETLRSGSGTEKQALLSRAAGIDTSTVHVFQNEYVRVAQRGAYRCKAAYGARSRGGDGQYGIFETFNPDPVVQTAEQALGYFK